ncbi:hypothetical protein E1293_19675 [Actinomadura darangshiensis]|uniref:Uncharacterized protein n=1 Tax=Actinomadura darangshiensis TaxID=705336 RepID=A0A4R5B439_9ACTN|nr:hypothetical protein [Actinomadura darangshiensis]TDD80968.1 hypothetical protein E1293_19675 [Actinomadura darangshiensis]
MAEQQKRTKRRFRFDPAGPVTGLFFLVLAGLFLSDGLSEVDGVPPEVLIPVVLIGLGLVGTVRVLTRARRRNLR